MSYTLETKTSYSTTKGYLPHDNRIQNLIITIPSCDFVFRRQPFLCYGVRIINQSQADRIIVWQGLCRQGMGRRRHPIFERNSPSECKSSVLSQTETHRHVCLVDNICVLGTKLLHLEATVAAFPPAAQSYQRVQCKRPYEPT